MHTADLREIMVGGKYRPEPDAQRRLQNLVDDRLITVQAITQASSPHFGQIDKSMSNTHLRRYHALFGIFNLQYYKVVSGAGQFYLLSSYSFVLILRQMRIFTTQCL
jgi:hypothetical protein